MLAFIGHMSGGKTYTAVRHMLDNLKHCDVVCSNIELKCRGVSDYLSVPCVLWKQNYYQLSESPTKPYHNLNLYDYDSYPIGDLRGHGNRKVFIYFDEASSLWDSIEHSGNSSIKSVAIWVRHSRKRGQEIFFIAQFASELHKRLRNHIQEFMTCVNSAAVRLPVIRCRLPSFLRCFIINTVVNDKDEILVASTWSKIDSRIYQCYDTAQIVVGSSTALSNNSHLTYNRVKRGSLWVPVIAVLVVLYFCSWSYFFYSVLLMF